MILDLSEEQELLKDTAQRFAATEYSFAHRRTTLASADGWSQANWQQLAQMGWLGIGLPEAYGGQGGALSDVSVVFEALGPAMVIEPLLVTGVLAAELILGVASEAQRNQWLPRIADGSARWCAALEEPSSRYSLNRVATRAERNADGYILNGKKSVVLGFGQAGDVLVSARTAGHVASPDGISLFHLHCEPEGSASLIAKRFTTIDGQHAADLQFIDFHVPDSALVGTSGLAHSGIQRAVDLTAAAASAEALGVARAAFSATAEYLKSRKQFGQVIGKFQSLQHRIADMYAAEQRAASAIMQLRFELDAIHEDADARAILVSATKAQVSRCARFIGQQSVQLHGALGISDEFIVGNYLKRLVALECTFGDGAYHLERFARLTQQ